MLWQRGDKTVEYAGMNLNNLKNSNRTEILRLLNNRGSMARKDIAGELGLTPAAVTQICGDLLKEGILREMGEMNEEKRVGRKKILVGIDETYAAIGGITIEGGETFLSVSTLRGTLICGTVIATDDGVPPEIFLARCAQELKKLLKKAGSEHILGVGVSIPGAVRRKDGTSILAIRVWKDEVPVRRILEKLLDVPVIVENNVKAFAEAELTFGVGRKADNLLFVKWGPGVGSAIAIDSEIYDNRKGRASELGHVVADKNGKLCTCGKRGCLETLVSAAGITEQVKAAFTKESMPELWRWCGGDAGKINETSIREWSAADDPALHRVFDRVLECFTRNIANAATVLAPDNVIYYGDMFEIPYFREHFVQAYRENDAQYRDGFLVHSELSGRIRFIGALAVVFNEKFLNPSV